MAIISNIFGYLLNFLYDMFNNYGLAIIVFSIILRIILLPITIKQHKSMRQSSKIQKEVQEIQKKYKNNPEKLQQETMDLYKREKMNPLSGCFSGIVQILIILSVFWLVSQPLTYMKKVDKNLIQEYTDEINSSGNKKSAYNEINIIQNKASEDERVYINMEFLGLDLSIVPTQKLNDYRVYIIPLLYIISSFVSIKITSNMQKNKNNKDKEKVVEAKKADEENSEFDTMQEINKNMMYMAPLMTVSIAIVAPLGLALYWFVSNVLTTIERVIITKTYKSEEEKENV